MAFVVLKADPKIFHPSANTPDFPEIDWLINPASRAIYDTVPLQYIKLNATSDDVEEMTAAEKTSVDATAAATTIAWERGAAKATVDSAPEWPGKLFRATIQVLIDEINVLRGLHSLAVISKDDVKTKVEAEIDTGNHDTA